MQLIQYKKLFLEEARAKLKIIEDQLVALERDPSSVEIAAGLLVTVHTLKSDAATMSYRRLANSLHQVEDLLNAAKQKTIRLQASDVDSLFIFLDAVRKDLEQIEQKDTETDLTTQTAFVFHVLEEKRTTPRSKPTAVPNNNTADWTAQYTPLGSYVEVGAEQLESVLTSVNALISQTHHLQRLLQKGNIGAATIDVHNLSAQLSNLRQGVLEVKMMPVRQYFAFLSRLVRDLAREGKKFITLDFKDNNLRFERHVLEALREACVHLVKNAVDHGFAEGEKGTVVVEFSLKGNSVQLAVWDTGRGVNWDEIAKQAIKSGKIKQPELQKMADDTRKQRLFTAGVSTMSKASLSSGRGVGWSSVWQTIEKLHGQLSFACPTSKAMGAGGACFVIRFPLTSTMFRALVWQWGPYRLALPLFALEKIIQLYSDHPVRVQRQFMVKDTAIPVRDVLELLGMTKEVRNAFVPGNVAIVAHEDRKVAIYLPHAISEQELIMETMQCLESNKIIAGVAVAEDSIPVVILNYHALMIT